jgi:hypothetical protein
MFPAVSRPGYSPIGASPLVEISSQPSEGCLSDAREAEALSRMWYPHFYTETTAGRFMVVRPDEPKLFFFTRPMAEHEFRSSLVSRLDRLETLLKVLFRYDHAEEDVRAHFPPRRCWRSVLLRGLDSRG